MSPARFRFLIERTGDNRRVLSVLMGYSSENSLRQVEKGGASLPADKAAWLETYALFRHRQMEARAVFLKEHPCPGTGLAKEPAP